MPHPLMSAFSGFMSLMDKSIVNDVQIDGVSILQWCLTGNILSCSYISDQLPFNNGMNVPLVHCAAKAD